MADLVREHLTLGSTITLAGYFTKRLVLGDLSDGLELERRIGYSPGTLALGWYVLYMVNRTPTAGEFVMAGYSHFSDGRIQGHLSPENEHVEDSLRRGGVDPMLHRRAQAEHFALAGADRLTKIRPVFKTDVYWHPDPNPIPQWQLTAPMDFQVAQFFPGTGGS
ncbi:MAG: hypothetical protein JNM08_03150 [Rubrivivax sp.]|nr:hypothetical protein [Rubrivivax sp.]